jgi:orotidine-5'-phosphate decarboxylase
VAEVIVALDLPTAGEALRLLDRIPGARWVKVGSVLMTSEGPALLQELTSRGLRVFLDLKWHDIPNTVIGAVEAARAQGVAMATVHTLGGAAMMRAAGQAAGRELGLVGVTVLTSHSPEEYASAVGRRSVDLETEAERLAGLAIDSGLRGIVCSAREATRARRRVGPEAWIVVPGIRRPGDPTGDQVRTAAPDQAVKAGASHLVVGRPILQASDPAAAHRDIAEAAG